MIKKSKSKIQLITVCETHRFIDLADQHPHRYLLNECLLKIYSINEKTQATYCDVLHLREHDVVFDFCHIFMQNFSPFLNAPLIKEKFTRK